MKAAALLLAAVLMAPLAVRADMLTPTQIEALQRKGWITPEFEAATHRLIDAQADAQKAKDDEAALEAKLPNLQKSADTEDAQVARLKTELEHYAHPDETDFAALLEAMKDTAAKPVDQMALAQAYVWTYPGGAHTPEAQQDVAQLQKKIADQVQAAKNADAATAAAQLKLLDRVKKHDLSLGEWRAFLQDKSRNEVQQYLGAPAKQDDEYWVYTGPWTVDPSTNLKAGLQLTFNGGRVQNVAPVPAQ